MVAFDGTERVAAQGAGRVWVDRFRAALLRDLPLHLVIATYFAIAGVLTLTFGRVHPIKLGLSYLDVWSSVGLWLLGCLLSARVVWRVLREPLGRPLGRLARTLTDELTPERAAGLLLFGAMALFMGAYTATKCLLPQINPFWFDPLEARIDRAAHFGVDPWRWLHPLLGKPEITRTIEVAYLPIWIGLTNGLLLTFCVLIKDEVLRRRYLITYLTGWIFNGTVMAGLFMSGGPAFYADIVGDPTRYGELTRYLSFDIANPISAAAEQRLLLAGLASPDAALAGGISAFPSLHVTMVTLCTLACWKLNRAVGVLVSMFAAVIVVGSVHLGWHYAVGDYYAIASTCAFWWLAGRLSRPRSLSKVAAAN